VLCGDFNCTPDSSVYRYLLGQQTLQGRGIAPWHDLARLGAEREGEIAAPTLDFWNNPRWRDAPTLEIPSRVDWILLQDLFNRSLPYPLLLEAGVFGTAPTPRMRIVPSDHYGVHVTLDFGDHG
jgi:endonuclease/exonuclease/phosphatase family metal-dependent hydrolase